MGGSNTIPIGATPALGRHTGAITLDLRHLSVEYVTAFHRTAAVRDLTLSIREGEAYGLVGESGCGKSTAALACVRYLPSGTQVSGEAFFLGRDVLKMNERELRSMRGQEVAMVYQDALAALNPALRIETQLTEVLAAHAPAGLGRRMSRDAARRRCIEMLERVQIADPELVLRRYPHQLSGGMQQRVLIAMALLLKPSLLIMDEPTTGLDVTVEAVVLDLINDLRRELNTAILFISHNLGVIAQLCDRVGVMYAGEMVEEAEVGELFHAPKHPYTLGLLRCIPRLGVSKHEYALWSIPGHVPALSTLPSGCIFAPRCPMARDACFEQQMALQAVDGSTHRTRCRFWNEIRDDLFDGCQQRTQPELCTWARAERPQPSAGAKPDERLLGVEDLRVHFRQAVSMLSLRPSRRVVRAVDGVTFHVPGGRTLGIVGESGCGKSTIARSVAGLAPITGGNVTFQGFPLREPVEKRPRQLLQGLQMVFQNPDSTLNPQKTVEEEVRRPLRLLHIVPRAEEDQTISQLLSAVNLNDSYRQRYPGQLSGGEKQRVAIARAFACQPSLLICDEPTSSLDVSVQSLVLNTILRLQDEHSISLLFISHDLSVVRYLSDDVLILYLGRVCEYGRVDQVFSPPQHPYVEALLSAVPVPDPTVRRARIRLEGSVPSATDPPTGCRFHTRCPRKVGPVCEQEEPPCRERDGLTVFCHIPLEELEQVQRAVR
jgi:peptide/nickel transport system ATP-binding protein